MSNEHYKIIVAGYNCYDRLERCLDSIWNQTYRNFSVCVVDDASTDLTQREYLARKTAEYGWWFIQREVNAGAPQSQFEAVQKLMPKIGDVLVWVDLDDAFLHKDSLAILDSYYDEDTAMTFGSYQPVPASKTCPPVTEYPRQCIRDRDYRNIHKWGLRYNHLRTVRWDLFRHLVPDLDFKRDGEWLKLAMDMAVMVPCLEMADGHHKFIPEPLYEYFSANPLSEWRKSAIGTNETHDYLASLPKKPPVWTQERPLREWLKRPVEKTPVPGPKPKIHVLIPSYNCKYYVDRTLDSVMRQTYQPTSVLLIDDASTEPGYSERAEKICWDRGYKYHRNEENMKCPYNLRLGVKLIKPDPDDVIFLLDGDDWLPYDALERLSNYYADDQDLWLTYGNYEPLPENNGQTLAMEYPDHVRAFDTYRSWQHCFNHPLTFKAHLFNALDDSDMQSEDGQWFTTAYDAVIMMPMLEMAGKDHTKFINKTLYYYNSVNEGSETLTTEITKNPTPGIIMRPRKERHVRTTATV